MKTAFLPRLRPRYLCPLLILGVILSENAYAQDGFIRQVSLRQEPLNESTGVREPQLEARIGI